MSWLGPNDAMYYHQFARARERDGSIAALAHGSAILADKRHQWLAELETLSPLIAGLDLRASTPDETYFDRERRRFPNKDAFNLSDAAHSEAIARWIELLAVMGVSKQTLVEQLRNVTGRGAYGAYCELASYGTLADAEISFDVQIPVTGDDILNPHGAILDGQLTISTPILFDVKAFGINEHLLDVLRDRLAQDNPDYFVAIEGNADTAIETIGDLADSNYAALVGELQTNRHARRGLLTFSLRPPQRVQSTVMASDPYRLAANHSDYAFRSARQFARNQPFMLIFALHPWLGGFRLTTNYDGDTDAFTRSLARRTFMQFRNDTKALFGITRGDASTLLSAMMFLDVSQSPTEQRNHWLYMNPNAKNPLPQMAWHRLAHAVRGINIDTFENDFY